jgi:prepilin-type N-terminal cleavage/methylation domain-containing protein
VRRAGFTLIEMMAVALLTAVVLAAAANFYIHLSGASRDAVEGVRADRRAVAVVDRVSRDLENAVLLKKPPDVDPLAYPWLFLAEAEGPLGAERLKFVSRGRLPRVSALRESDLEMVGYWLEDRGDGSFTLLRWSAPHLPDQLVRDFPADDDPGVSVLAEGVAAFGVELVGETGDWVANWDSSQLVESSELPLAARVSVQLLPEAPDGTPLPVDDPGQPEGGPEVVMREVLLPLRPLDLESLRNPDAKKGDEDKDQDDDTEGDSDGDSAADGSSQCTTVGQCLAAHPEITKGLDSVTRGILANMAGDCVKDVAVPLPGCR